MSKKVCESLLDTLAQVGVRQIFGMTGDALNPFLDAIRRDGRFWNAAAAQTRGPLVPPNRNRQIENWAWRHLHSKNDHSPRRLDTTSSHGP